MEMDVVREIVAQHRACEGPLLPILHEVQQRAGHISENAIRVIAQELNLTRAEVYGVVSFYHDFRLQPLKGPTLKVCRAEACQARGVESLLDDVGIKSDSSVLIEPVYCLGLCSVGPAALTEDGKVHARLNADRLKRLMGDLS